MKRGKRGIETAGDALEALRLIVDRALEEGSRTGYFAAVYSKVTAKVAEGIATGFFDDGDRMHRLDAIFASRFIDALEAYQDGGTTTRSWELAFTASATARPVIVQHLLLGINAHINLDLGIAAASTAPGASLPGLRRDFDRVNEILALQIAGITRDLAAVSPWIGLLDSIGGRHDEEIIRFSIEAARADAWRFAVELAPLEPAHWPGPIGARDARVAHLARKILRPGCLTLGLALIRARESNDVRRNIEALLGADEPDLALVESRVRQARSSAGLPPG